MNIRKEDHKNKYYKNNTRKLSEKKVTYMLTDAFHGKRIVRWIFVPLKNVVLRNDVCLVHCRENLADDCSAIAMTYAVLVQSLKIQNLGNVCFSILLQEWQEIAKNWLQADPV